MVRRGECLRGCEIFCLNSNCTLSFESLLLLIALLVMFESQSIPPICSSACCGLKGESRFNLAKRESKHENRLLSKVSAAVQSQLHPVTEVDSSVTFSSLNILLERREVNACSQFFACPASFHSHPLDQLESTCR